MRRSETRRYPLLALAGVLLPGAVMGTEPPAGHPIEYRRDSCMEDGDWTAQAMRDCAWTAHEEWQAEVERLHDRLASVLGADARDALELSRQRWEASRDADYAFIAAYHADLERAELGEGELVPLAEQLGRNAVLESRVRQLQRYLDGLASLPEPPPDAEAD